MNYSQIFLHFICFDTCFGAYAIEAVRGEENLSLQDLIFLRLMVFTCPTFFCGILVMRFAVFNSLVFGYEIANIYEFPGEFRPLDIIEVDHGAIRCLKKKATRRRLAKKLKF